MKKIVVLLLLCSYISSYAQRNKQIIIQTQSTSLVLTVAKNGRLLQSYFGKRLQSAQDSLFTGGQEMFITAGMETALEPAFRTVHTDGNPSLVLEYVSHETKLTDNNVTETIINLKDPVYPVTVALHIAAYSRENVLKTWSDIKHTEKSAIQLTDYASGMLHFKSEHYWLTQFHGDWAKEMGMEESELTHGIKVLDSKLGARANMYQSPVFFLSLDKPSTETAGDVMAGTLAWTGNFKFAFEIDQRDWLHISAGMNSYASNYSLAPNETFITPAFIYTLSSNGKGEASRNLHRWARNYGVLDGTKPRLTLLNNWEATRMDFDEKQLVTLFDGAVKIGVDLFLLDDGWFGNNFPRNDDKTGLGDWQENAKKLPHGLEYLVQQAKEKGTQFGIWVEPEMVNPKSDLYKQHPDWILKLPNREENYQRNQLILDLTNPQVQDFVYNTVVGMLDKNPGIAYIKWDCNRTMSNTYSPFLKDKQSHLFIEYTRSLYKVLDKIRAKYPHLPVMLCSGGGGRTDYGALKYFTEFWPSDNTDGLERIFIQWGYSYFFPANTIAAHVTNWSKVQSLKFRTDVAMMGKLGYDIKVDGFTEKEVQFTKQAVATYKRLSNVIWQGDLYRIISPYEENRAVLMYVDDAKKKAVLFNYNLNPRYKQILSNVKLQGLNPTKKYRIKEVNLFPDTKSVNPDDNKVLSGEYLMTIGLNLAAGKLQPLTSNVYEITEE
ncbi:MAG: alpha-galactosidase [Filimonas sp.]|nr:alpha-galactosidase [Filimonas sp.]